MRWQSLHFVSSNQAFEHTAAVIALIWLPCSCAQCTRWMGCGSTDTTRYAALAMGGSLPLHRSSHCSWSTHELAQNLADVFHFCCLPCKTVGAVHLWCGAFVCACVQPAGIHVSCKEIVHGQTLRDSDRLAGPVLGMWLVIPFQIVVMTGGSVFPAQLRLAVGRIRCASNLGS